MRYLIYLLFFLLSFGQLGRISFLDQQANIYLHELMMGFVVIGHMGQIRQIRLIGIWKWTFFFLTVLLLSLINNFWQFNLQQNLIGFLYWGRLVLYFVFFLILFNWGSKGSEENKGVLKRGLDIFATLTVIFSYLQYFLYPNLRNLYYLGWDPHHYRVFGLFFDTSITGIILVMMFFWVAEWRNIGFIRPISLIGLIGLILLTYSRITYISFIVGLIYYFLVTPRRSPSRLRQGSGGPVGHLRDSVLILLFSVLIFLLPRPFGEGVKLERIFTIEARAVDFKVGLKLWLEKPILGYGYNRLRYVRKMDNLSHSATAFSSSFLTILVASGVIGLIGLIGLIGGMFKQGNQLTKTIILVVITASLFDNVLLNNFVLLLLLVFFSISSILLSHKIP